MVWWGKTCCLEDLALVTYAESLVLAWRYAAGEAYYGKAAEIEPAHLLLGLCKICDVNLGELFAVQPDLGPAERKQIELDVATLRRIFGSADIPITQFRRRLRTTLTNQGQANPLDNQMHRSPAARRIFDRAGAIAGVDPATAGVLRPQHLLQALFETTGSPWMSLLAEMGVHDAPRRMFGRTPGGGRAANQRPVRLSQPQKKRAKMPPYALQHPSSIALGVI